MIYIWELIIIEGSAAVADSRVRINKVKLWNLKSVSYGEINMKSADSLRQEKANIMGLYGQNAAGKTVVIEALAIIKHILSGEKIPPHYLDCISKGKDECTIEVEFSVVNETLDIDCLVIYKCILSRRNDPSESNPKSIIMVTNERLRTRGMIYGENLNLHDIARADEYSMLVSPVKKCKVLFGSNKKDLIELERQKIIALYSSRSFIFSTQAFKAIFQQAKSETNLIHHKSGKKLINSSYIFISLLRYYAQTLMMVINEQTWDSIGMYIINNTKEDGIPIGLPLLDDYKFLATEAFIDDIKSILPNLNQVLSTLIPGLTIECRYEKVSFDEGDKSYIIEFFSCRDGLGTFPFKNESLGIKKIVSIITLIIEAYNNPSFTLVIDELDANIFEHLLGEIVDIMGTSGKGQLIFTSHNLRPLERLSPQFIWFATTNPENRYVQMTKKASNNLRDMYLRAILLGHEDMELYNGESKHSLSYVFRKMGRRN